MTLTPPVSAAKPPPEMRFAEPCWNAPRVISAFAPLSRLSRKMREDSVSAKAVSRCREEPVTRAGGRIAVEDENNPPITAQEKLKRSRQRVLRAAIREQRSFDSASRSAPLSAT